MVVYKDIKSFVRSSILTLIPTIRTTNNGLFHNHMRLDGSNPDVVDKDMESDTMKLPFSAIRFLCITD